MSALCLLESLIEDVQRFSYRLTSPLPPHYHVPAPPHSHQPRPAPPLPQLPALCLLESLIEDVQRVKYLLTYPPPPHHHIPAPPHSHQPRPAPPPHQLPSNSPPLTTSTTTTTYYFHEGYLFTHMPATGFMLPSNLHVVSKKKLQSIVRKYAMFEVSGTKLIGDDLSSFFIRSKDHAKDGSISREYLVNNIDLVHGFNHFPTTQRFVVETKEKKIPTGMTLPHQTPCPRKKKKIPAGNNDFTIHF
jgi:hypothetical protein